LARLVSPSLAAVGVALLVLDARPGLGWAALISALAVGAAFGGRR
jgi:hypothetical protein